MDILFSLKKLAKPRQELILNPVLLCSEPYLLSKVAESYPGIILYIVSDESKLKDFNEALSFFTDRNIITLPAWDSLPYDRVSPNQSVVAARLQALSQILTTQDAIIVTSVNSLLQLLPPRQFLAENIITLECNTIVNREALLSSLIRNGFNRTATTNEAGEFSVRGSIIDIYSSGSEFGWRLDFFGERLDSIKTFDPATQVSVGTLNKINIIPASEIIFTASTIENFRINYRKFFEINIDKDFLYNAISEGNKFPGYEHWMPLFYNNRLETLWEYAVPELVVYDSTVKETLSERLNLINEYYQERKIIYDNKKFKETVYNPVPPELMWLAPAMLHSLTHNNYFISFSQFQQDLLSAVNVPIKKLPHFIHEGKTAGKTTFEMLKNYIAQERKNRQGQHKRLKIMIACFSAGSIERMQTILSGHDIHSMLIPTWSEYNKLSGKTVGLILTNLEEGFETEEFAIISEQDLLGQRTRKKEKSRNKLENLLSEAAGLTAGELVVHKEHGVGRFEGLETIVVSNTPHDCLRIIYEGNDKLFIPVENIEVISRYGSQEENVVLDKLGGVGWQNRKARLKNRIREIAASLLKTAAERELHRAPILEVASGLYEEFALRFHYTETDDQLAAIEDVRKDLASGKPMDRLICGDVGFGKTEVALRSAFVCVMSEASEKKHQVAVIAPTTLLVRQHYHNFSERFKGLPVRIKQLSRLVSAKEAAQIRHDLVEGNIDIIIGTHALLASTVKMHNLTLLIIDEEQHFGVVQKEKLKSLRTSVHVLTLSATPIPRTLQMSLAGIKELSLIATPPVDRQAVKTFIMPYDSVVIKEAINRELFRGGKIFYVCPRIEDLEQVESNLREMLPKLKIVKAHGQMPATKLDQIMNDFYDGAYDLLLATTIIESGLDIPSANTMIIHRADMFGLAQLYQLRGRVGRGKIKAYAYLTVPASKQLSSIATKRLGVMNTLDSLGAGFSLASHDMDIRGFGNLVGDEQSGHIREVGIELYQEMLKEAVEELVAIQQGQIIQEESWSPQINVGLAVLIPEEYVTDLSLRLGLYRRAANLLEDEIDAFAVELIDRFGPLPREVSNLLQVIKLKQQCRKLCIDKIDAGPKGVVVGFRNNKSTNPEKILDYMTKNPKRAKARADQKLVLAIETENAEVRLTKISNILAELLS